jgi:hypothetical protein
MPAGLPGATSAQNQANPSQGQFVIMDALSGPKGSPFDKDPTGKNSTGAVQTGIGVGANLIINIATGTNPATAAQAIRNAGFTDDQGEGSGSNSTRIYIGGGRAANLPAGSSTPTVAGVAGTNPYTAGFALVGAGNGGSRDGGAGPAFTGFTGKMVTAVGSVANGAAIETGFTNRSGKTMAATESAFGSATAANAAPS